ncbi:MAG: SoxR reducing system RseC family protein [Eubacteriales bacterium]|nr:SoxR reducing system RseC family protein [Eubacteriales bacterium]
MQQTATVTKLLSGNKAELTVHRQTACGHDCSKCGGCGELVTKPIVVIADNTIGADVGDSVVITGSSKQVLGLAAVVYLVPFVLFFVLYAVAAVVPLPLPEVWGCVGFVVGILLAVLANKRQKNAKPVYTISKP